MSHETPPEKKSKRNSGEIAWDDAIAMLGYHLKKTPAEIGEAYTLKQAILALRQIDEQRKWDISVAGGKVEEEEEAQESEGGNFIIF